MPEGEVLMENTSNAVLANEIKHLRQSLTDLTQYLKERDKEIDSHHATIETRMAKLEAASVSPVPQRSLKERLADNPGFWLFAGAVVYVGGKDMILPLLKAFGVGL